MGACLSCLGLRRDSTSSERTRLLSHHPEDPSYAYNYGSWGSGQPTLPSENVLSPEDAKHEQEALDKITRWASDQIVEIFPHRNGMPQMNGSAMIDGEGSGSTAGEQEHQDILLSMIPGDKSKRSIRIYPASGPGSRDVQSLRSQRSHTLLDGVEKGKGKGAGVFVKLNVDLP